MGIRAHPRLTKEKDLEGPSWHPVSWLRRADRSSTSSFHLADSAGKLLGPLFVSSLDHVKPSPRSHRRSLTQHGERRWRRGMAGIPLVNPSELSSGMGGDPRLIGSTAG